MGAKVVVVGASLGGLRALQVLLGGLPKDFPAPVVVVQHRHVSSEAAFSTLLQTYSALPVSEATDKIALAPGQVYIAPTDYHLLVDSDGLGLSTEGPVNHSRPSIDVLFESASYAFGASVIGVVLTGSTSDGARGAALIKARGGVVLVQDPATAESGAMPAAAIAATNVDKIVPLSEIAPALIELCRAERL